MSSSEVRIIKDAKITHKPVVIALHDFTELNPLELGQRLDENEGIRMTGSLDAEGSTNGLPISDNVFFRPEEEILQEARKQAQSILLAAESEAEALRAQAAADGRKQGLEEARSQMQEQLKEANERANSLVATAENEAKRVLLDAEPKIIDLVLAISQKVINEEVEARPTIVLALVKNALDKVRDQNQIVIHVSQADYEFIMQSRIELQSMVGAEQSLSIVADTVLCRGGCLIETAFGTVEAGIDTQFEAIRRALQGRMQ